MIRFLLLAILFLTINHISAQGFNAGITLGMNASQIHGDLFSGYNKPGIHAGLLIEYPIQDKTWIGGELIYSELGSQRKLLLGSSIPEEQSKIQLNYISLPVYVRIQPNSRLSWLSAINFMLGIENSYLINAKIQDRDDEEIIEYFNDWNVSGLVGIRYAFNEKIGLEFRINESINLIFNNNKVEQINANSLRNRSVTFMIKYYL
ncbi:MAG: PorT family protein [Bacteroidia bacterium]|nr:PorT family protein [Bacteroidia bacterium]